MGFFVPAKHFPALLAALREQGFARGLHDPRGVYPLGAKIPKRNVRTPEAANLAARPVQKRFRNFAVLADAIATGRHRFYGKAARGVDAHVVNLPPLFSFSKPGAHLYVEGVHKANWKPVRRLRVSLNHQTPGAGLKAERELQQALREHVQKPARKTR